MIVIEPKYDLFTEEIWDELIPPQPQRPFNILPLFPLLNHHHHGNYRMLKSSVAQFSVVRALV